MTVVVTGSDLTPDQVCRVARGGERVEADAAAIERMDMAREVVDRAVRERLPAYGLTVGVGAALESTVDADQTSRFNHLLVELADEAGNERQLARSIGGTGYRTHN